MADFTILNDTGLSKLINCIYQNNVIRKTYKKSEIAQNKFDTLIVEGRVVIYEVTFALVDGDIQDGRPVSNAGILISNGIGNGSQVYISSGTYGLYKRARVGSPPTWNAWSEFASNRQGVINVIRNDYPQLDLLQINDNDEVVRNGQLLVDGPNGAVTLQNRSTNSSANRTILHLNNETSTNANLLKLYKIVNNQGTDYQVYHTGNKPTVADVGGSNPNLLDNPWFTINQRGVESWSSQYGPDRWIVSNLTGTRNAAGFWAFRSLTGSGQLLQRLPGDTLDAFVDKQVTITVKRGTSEDSAVYMSATFTVPSKDGTQASAPFSNPIHDETALLFYNQAGGFWGVQIRFNWNQEYALNIRAVKLELGSVSTLANDVVPNYAEELAKCQRYYLELKGSNPNQILMQAYNPSTTAVAILVPCKMRAVPSVTIQGNIAYFRSNNSTTTIHDITGTQIAGSHLDRELWVNLIVENAPANGYGLVRAKNDTTAKIILNAEL